MKNKKILITGATGFVGTNLVQEMKKQDYENLVTLSSNDYNLLEQNQVRKMFADVNQEIVIHLAALSGGIKTNMEIPADFFYKNLIMQTMVMHEACKSGEKYLTCMGGCSYP